MRCVMAVAAAMLAAQVPTAMPVAAQISYPPVDGCKFNYVAGTPTTIANTTTETTIATAPSQGTLVIPACATSGAWYVQVHVDGYYTAATVAPGTLTQFIKLNGVNVCSVVLGNLATTGAANLGAHGNAYITVNAAGAVKCTGFLGYQVTGTMEAPGYWSTVGSPTITPGTALTLDYTGKWSAAVNTITATAVFATLTK